MVGVMKVITEMENKMESEFGHTLMVVGKKHSMRMGTKMEKHFNVLQMGEQSSWNK